MDVIIAEKPTIAYIIASALGADKKEDGFHSKRQIWSILHREMRLAAQNVWTATYRRTVQDSYRR